MNEKVKDTGKFKTDNKGNVYQKTEMGIDAKTGEKNFVYKKIDTKWFIKDKVFRFEGKNYSLDHNYITHMLVNQNKFRVVIENKSKHGDEFVWKSIEMKPAEKAILPHKYYTVWIDRINNTKDNGTPVFLDVVYGIENWNRYKSLKQATVIKFEQ